MTQDHLKETIGHREKEVSDYEMNYNNYTLMIESMGKIKLPENLKVYIGKEDKDVPIDLSLEDAHLVSQYNYLERLKKLQRSEFLEMNKVKITIEALKTQLT